MCLTFILFSNFRCVQDIGLQGVAEDKKRRRGKAYSPSALLQSFHQDLNIREGKAAE